MSATTAIPASRGIDAWHQIRDTPEDRVIERSASVARTLSSGAARLLSEIPPPDLRCDVIVTIPIHNEADGIVESLRALDWQLDDSGARLNPTRYEILALVNNTTDASLDIARRFASDHPKLRLHVVQMTLPPALAHVGTARRLLMDAAAERFGSLHKPCGVIATTDADTEVSATWITATMRSIERGADAVGGRILFSRLQLQNLPLSIRLPYLRDVGYRYLAAELTARLDPRPVDPWPHHFQNFGASIAVTARTYERAGRMPVRPSLEDVAFFERLERVGARIQRPPDVRVFTSSRLIGKTSFGLAVQLREWQQQHEAGVARLVPDATTITARAQARRLLRAIWQGYAPDSEIGTVEGLLHIQAGELPCLIGSAATFGSLWQDTLAIAEASAPHSVHIPINLAITELREELENVRGMAPPLSGPDERKDPVGNVRSVIRIDERAALRKTKLRSHAPRRQSPGILQSPAASAQEAAGLED